MRTPVEYSRRALQTLRRMPKPTADRIREKIEALAVDRRSQTNNIKMLKGYDGMFRLRVGDWRVLYRDDVDSLRIIDIDARGNVYSKGRP